VSLFSDALLAQSRAVLDLCRANGLKLATAESCTGGLVAAVLTEIAGSSDVVERGFVTYSNEAKQELLGVAAATLAAHGAVSEATAREMAQGALRASRADVAVSITGVAGPGGGSADKPDAAPCGSPPSRRRWRCWLRRRAASRLRSPTWATAASASRQSGDLRVHQARPPRRSCARHR